MTVLKSHRWFFIGFSDTNMLSRTHRTPASLHDRRAGREKLDNDVMQKAALSVYRPRGRLQFFPGYSRGKARCGWPP